MQVQRVPEERLVEELAKVEDRRDPPVAVVARLPVDGLDWDGLLYGWALNPNGGDDGLRGLVVAPREYAPGFWSEFCGWVPADAVRQRES